MVGVLRALSVLAAGVAALVPAVPCSAASFSSARIYIEYNRIPNDLGFHVALDGEDWKSLRILSPSGATIFDLTGKGGYAKLGLTELFFEGAEPSLDDVPLEELLGLFPEGRYKFIGTTLGGRRLSSVATLSHAVPDAPAATAEVDDGTVVIRWEPVSQPPEGFPDRRIEIVAYQVIVGDFQVSLPASSTQATVPPEYVESLGPGEHPFEVLAIDKSGNQTIREGSFEIE